MLSSTESPHVLDAVFNFCYDKDGTILHGVGQNALNYTHTPLLVNEVHFDELLEGLVFIITSDATRPTMEMRLFPK